ncbi:MAG: MATE family efflux transporter [Clostridia bacterium]|nr:MATE family efflux transporter [Clostridia bacterium]
MKKSTTNLTEGNIPRLIIMFALPILLGQVFQNLYHSVDSMVVGNYVGTTALAAVTSCSDISMLLVGFFTGLSAGSGVLFARYFGAKDHDSLHKAIHTALLFSFILGVIMATLGIIFTPFLLTIVDCPVDVRPEAEVYLRIYLIGILFTALYNVGSGVLRAVGNSRAPFIYLVISSVTNIVLDILLVVVFRMGVAGVGIATIISQFVSVVLVTRNMMRTNDVYKLVLKDLGIDIDILKEVIRLGLPAAIQSSLISISNLFVQRYVNGFGSDAMAGIGAAEKIDKFVGMIAQSLGLSTATFVSQNYGAKKIDRAYRGIRTVLLMNLVPLSVMGIIVFVNSGWAIRLFTDNPNAIYYGAKMLTTMTPFFICQALNQTFSNAVRGFGKSTVVMVLSILGMVGCRQLFLAIAMHIQRNVVWVYIGFPLGWFCSAVFVMIYYFIFIKKKFGKTVPND